MSSPLISVIIPVFNREHLLKRAIESVLAQSFLDYELIVVDDGSSDCSYDVGKSYEQVQAIQQRNAGVSSARNLGAKHAKGEWLAFLDSDDQWLPEKLEEQVKLIDSEVMLIHTEENWIRNGNLVKQPNAYKKEGGDQFFKSLKLCAISPSTVLLRKSLFNKLGGFREDFPVCEDYDLWLKIVSLYEVTLVDIPLINKHAGHENQLSFQYKAMDYWRVKSMNWILENRRLSDDKKNSLKAELIKKINILEKGYLKHSNLENLEEILRIKEDILANS